MYELILSLFAIIFPPADPPANDYGGKLDGSSKDAAYFDVEFEAE